MFVVVIIIIIIIIIIIYLQLNPISLIYGFAKITN